MFVRFRTQRRRLQASLVHSRRADGKVQAEHVGALGSVDASVSVRSRLEFWAKLPQRLAPLDNRVRPDEQSAIINALHARIPIVTPDDIHSVQTEGFEASARVWDMLRDWNTSHIEGLKGHIALAETKIAAMAPDVARATEASDAARAKLSKLKRGEAVVGGLEAPVDPVAILKASGFTARDFRRMRLTGAMTEAEFELALVEANISEAVDKAFERAARRVIRAREERPSLPVEAAGEEN